MYDLLLRVGEIDFHMFKINLTVTEMPVIVTCLNNQLAS